MRQITFANQASFEKYARPSRREQFLDTMETVVPWSDLEALIEPYYPKAGNGRQPVGLSIMLRIYFLQHWFNLSDPGAEDALYESSVLRRFTGVDLGRAAAPDETTILNFRHLLEQHELCGKILDTVNLYLDSKGIRVERELEAEHRFCQFAYGLQSAIEVTPFNQSTEFQDWGRSG
jgi:IS5 family transposase